MIKILTTITTLILVLFACMGWSFTKTFTFFWEQPVDLPYISGWVLYVSETSGTGYIKVKDISYDGIDTGTFTTQASFTRDAPLGTVIPLYFVLTAKDKRGLEGVKSKEAVGRLIVLPIEPSNIRLEK